MDNSSKYKDLHYLLSPLRMHRCKSPWGVPGRCNLVDRIENLSVMMLEYQYNVNYKRVSRQYM